jgi:hypothetical protein
MIRMSFCSRVSALFWIGCVHAHNRALRQTTDNADVVAGRVM